MKKIIISFLLIASIILSALPMDVPTSNKVASSTSLIETIETNVTTMGDEDPPAN